MIIYRIQNSRNQGPFCGMFYPTTSQVSDDWERAHGNPTPWLDGITWDSGTACACLRHQLRYWWTRALYRELRKQGFKLVRLEVPDEMVLTGSRQVVYYYQHSKPINRR